jgi:hypothetical protein
VEVPEPSLAAEPLPPLFGSRRAVGLAAGVLLLLTLVVFGDLLFFGGNRILSLPAGDTAKTFVPWYEFTTGQMLNGRLPLWNPHLYSGAPCLGGFQEALLYPPTWLHFFLQLPQAINWGIALHVFLAGFFTCLWVMHRGLHVAGGIVAGAAYMLGGAFFMHITPGHIPNLQTMVWPPLIFLAIDDLAMTRSLRGAWLGAGAIAMQILAGHPQYVYYTILVGGPYALVALYRATSRKTFIAGVAIMCLGGVALSAVQLFTGLQAAGESLRSAVNFNFAKSFPFPPEHLLTMVLPNVFGPPNENYWGRWFLWESSLFVGVTTVALAIYGLVHGRREDGRWTALAFFAAVMVVAFGYYTPLYRVLFHVLPGFASFRGISKISFLASLFLAYLAAIGTDRLIRETHCSARAAWAVLACAFLAAGIGAFIWISGSAGPDGIWGTWLRHVNWADEAYEYGRMRAGPTNPGFYASAARGTAQSLFWAAGVCVLLAALWWFVARRDRRGVWGIVALASIELVCFARQNLPTFELGQVAGMEQTMRGLIEPLGPDARVITGMPGVVLGAGGNEAWGDDPMVLRRYAQFMAFDTGHPPDELTRTPYPFFKQLSPSWRLIRVKEVLVPPPGGQGLVPVAVPGETLGHAQLVESYRVLDDPAQILATVGSRDFDPKRIVLLEHPVDLPPAPADQVAAGPAGSVQIQQNPDERVEETDRLEIEATIVRPCLLLISDTYSTGWRVRPLDDSSQRRYDVVPADFTLRGIPLRPGKHHFILEYRPAAYVIGKWVSIVAVLIWLVAGVKLGRQTRRTTRST